jgi:hypothetical protein
MEKNVNYKPRFLDEQKNLNIELSTLENLRCPDCGNQTFQKIFILKKIDAEKSPTGKDGLIPLEVLGCNKCGAVPKEVGGKLLG